MEARSAYVLADPACSRREAFSGADAAFRPTTGAEIGDLLETGGALSTPNAVSPSRIPLLLHCRAYVLQCELDADSSDLARRSPAIVLLRFIRDLSHFATDSLRGREAGMK